MSGITKETFKSADADTKLDILFDYHSETSSDIKDIKKLLETHPKDCITRIEKLENTKLKATIFSGSMGFIGGFAAMVAKLKFWS